MSITVNSVGQNMAMDGRRISNYSTPPINPVTDAKTTVPQQQTTNIHEVFNDVQSQIQQLQDISDILGRKLLFNVNEELGKVVVKVVDPSTNKIIKEIPSADIQKLQIRIKEALGLLVDENI